MISTVRDVIQNQQNKPHPKLIEILIISLILLSAILGLYKPRIKGAIGESKVAFRLKLLNKKEFKVIHNILLKSEGWSSQIDHVIVSIYGVFVIETKNYKGWIHGHENSEYWVQSIYEHKTRFRNPVIQVKGHVRTLKRVLREYDQVVYYPIVVFSGQGELKNVYSVVPVVYARQLLRTIVSVPATPSFMGSCQAVSLLQKDGKRTTDLHSNVPPI